MPALPGAFLKGHLEGAAPLLLMQGLSQTAQVTPTAMSPK